MFVNLGCMCEAPVDKKKKWYGLGRILEVHMKKSGGPKNGKYLIINASATSATVSLDGLDSSKTKLPDTVKLNSLDSIAGTFYSRII